MLEIINMLYREDCQTTEYTCINKTTQLVVNTSDFTQCDKTLGFIASKWHCEQATGSGIMVDLEQNSNLAPAISGSVYIMWIGFAIIILIQAIMLGTWLYRK